MANWISSKLKVAETFLQQIDQQAAESLGKNENPRSDELGHETPTKTSETVPLKDQLKKKTPENSDLIGKLRSDRNLNTINSIKINNRDRDKLVPASVDVKPSLSPKSNLTDSDWTQLLSAPSKPVSLAGNRSNGVPGMRALRKDGRSKGSLGSNFSALEENRSQKGQNSVLKILQKSDTVLDGKMNVSGVDVRPNDGEDSRFSDSVQRTSSVELQSGNEDLERSKLYRKDAGASIMVKNNNDFNEERNGGLNTIGNGEQLHSKDGLMDRTSHSTNVNRPSVMVSDTVDDTSGLKMGVNDEPNRIKNVRKGTDESNMGQRSIISMNGGTSSASDAGSDSETDSSSASDSEIEHEMEERKRRREQILAEKAAAKAIEAIKGRENMVARLEGEKQSLEKILEVQAKQQAQEASELQMTMMETMEAVELEKQKHNNTRMEALPRMVKLETANADLSRSLATAQWDLEVQVNEVAELCQQIELKEASHEELRRKISSTHQSGYKFVASKGVEFEHDILEAEYYFITDKLGRLQEKAKALETNIEMTQKEMENPTEVEVELKRRLGQLTDHLIQKQAQVEALSSEKATQLLRIEAVSRLLEENKSMMDAADFPSTSSRGDLESGIWERSNSKLRPLFAERMRSGRQQLGSLVRQLDSIYFAGAVFLRRNSTARTWSLVYLVCLHFWVLYILMSHSPVSNEATSGAIVSLENINNTGGV